VELYVPLLEFNHSESTGAGTGVSPLPVCETTNSALSGIGERRRIVVNLRAFSDPKKRPSVRTNQRCLVPQGWDLVRRHIVYKPQERMTLERYAQSLKTFADVVCTESGLPWMNKRTRRLLS
jgi:hypothetical protein